MKHARSYVTVFDICHQLDSIEKRRMTRQENLKTRGRPKVIINSPQKEDMFVQRLKGDIPLRNSVMMGINQGSIAIDETSFIRDKFPRPPTCPTYTSRLQKHESLVWVPQRACAYFNSLPKIEKNPWPVRQWRKNWSVHISLSSGRNRSHIFRPIEFGSVLDLKNK